MEKSPKKHAFASVGFPGLVGCLSGMNDAGLALAVHEVRMTADFSPILNPKGEPYTLCFREILEQCTTIDEAEKLLRTSQRSTILSLAICDRKGGAVFEMTPRTVAVRRGSDGLCINTNHFRTPELRLLELCPRYSILSKAAELPSLGVTDVAKQLDSVNLGVRTVQSMIFEPTPLVLHVAMGKCPATKEPYRTIELRGLFEGGK
jgi:predicted choloylglycine hydrolase